MAAGTPQPPGGSAGARPLFRGYALVALVAAWLAGVALRPLGPLARIPPGAWLALASAVAVAGLVTWVARRHAAPAPASRGARVVLAGGLLGCALALGAARAAAADTSGDPSSVARLASGRSILLHGIVVAEPDLRAGYRLLTIEVSEASADGGRDWQAATGRVEADVVGPDDWFAPAYGDAVSLSGTLRPLAGSYAPPGVLARLSGARATIRSRGNGDSLLAALFALRVRLAQAIQRALPEPEAALLIGILLGLKTPALRARQPLFTETGTIHLVVPAGLKVSTLAELSSATVRRLGRWPRTLAALVAVGIYAALGGGGPAAIRAAVMGALLALAPALGRAYNVFTALALAVLLMTVLEPALLYDAGFQLTALATAGLPLLTPRIARRLVVWLRWLPFSAVIAELLAVTLAAQIATLPVLALTFHIISFVAPLANLLTVPLLAPLLVLGSLVATVGAVGGPLAGTLGLALAWVVWPLLAFVNGAIALCAALPGAFVLVGDVPAVLAALYYAVLVGAVWRLGPLLRRWRTRARALAPGPHRFSGPALTTSMERARGGTTHVRLSRGALAAVLGLALLGAGGAAAPALASAGTARLSFLDVGAGGEASLLRLPSGVTVLINGGPDGPALAAALAGRLPSWQRSLDLALLTDPRGGDVRGLADAAAHFSIARGADAGMVHPSADDLAWLDALRRAGAIHTTVREGAVIHLASDTVLRVLAPPQSLFPPGQGTTTASNDTILRLQTPGLRVLFLGAADDYALDALAYSGEPLGADVVTVALPSGAPLDLGGPLGTVLRQAHPRLIVVGSAPISPTAQTALAAADADAAGIDAEVASTLGALVYRIAAAGTIELSGGAGGWSLGG